MCGIAGFLNYSQKYDQNDLLCILKNMSDEIIHRGPDSGGEWLAPDNKICFSHRRLSIVDLSPAGYQPMLSHSSRYVIVFNGEIYNHLELRKKIESDIAVKWRGHSDTETFLAAVELYGVKRALTMSVGMFAMAIYDQQERKLFIARDRMGEKPLYYGWNNPVTQSGLIFGSELSVFNKHPEFERIIDTNSISNYLRYSYIPHSASIYKNVSKLLPGCLMTVNIDDKQILIDKYFELEDVIVKGKSNPFQGTFDDAVEVLEHLIRGSVKKQMLSDVPVGAFLSGGIDSSTIVSIMKEVSSAPVKTFSIGFDVKDFNESEYAARVAKYIGTDHVEYTISEKEAIEIIPDIPKYFTEPFADSSQIPTILLSRIARKDVTVALSGDAGDELFGGYNRYVIASNFIKKLNRFPRSVRTGLANSLMCLKPETYNRLFSFTNYSNLGEKVYKFANALSSSDIMDMYLKTVSHFENPFNYLNFEVNNVSILDMLSPGSVFNDLNDIEKMMYVDMRTYLVDDILVKVDRSAMSTSLETRVPFLDPSIIEFSWSLPFEYKINRSQGKKILRDLLSKKIPKEMFDRPKMGFGVPLTKWTRYDLKDWVYDTLDSRKIKSQGYLNDHQVQLTLNDHMTGKTDDGYRIWDLLMFQSWIDKNI